MLLYSSLVILSLWHFLHRIHLTLLTIILRSSSKAWFMHTSLLTNRHSSHVCKTCYKKTAKKFILHPISCNYFDAFNITLFACSDTFLPLFGTFAETERKLFGTIYSSLHTATTMHAHPTFKHFWRNLPSSMNL